MFTKVIEMFYNPSTTWPDLEIGSSVTINEKVNKGAEKMIGMKGVLDKIWMCVDVPRDASTPQKDNTHVYVLVFPDQSAHEKTLADAVTISSLRKPPELLKYHNSGEYWVKSSKCLSLVPEFLFPERTQHVDDTFPKKVEAPWMSKEYFGSLKCFADNLGTKSVSGEESKEGAALKKTSEELVMESQERFYANSKKRMESMLQKFALMLQEDRVEEDPLLYAEEDWVEEDPLVYEKL